MPDHTDENSPLHESSFVGVEPFMDGAFPGSSRGETVKEAIPAVTGALLVHMLLAMMVLALPLDRLPRDQEKSFVTVNLVATAGIPSGSAGSKVGGAETGTPAEVMDIKETSSEKAKPDKPPPSGAEKHTQRVRRSSQPEKTSGKPPGHGKTAPTNNQLLISKDHKKTDSFYTPQSSGSKSSDMDSSAGEGHGPEGQGGKEPGGGSAGTPCNSPSSSATGSGSSPEQPEARGPDQMPKVIQRIEPAYPPEARRSGISGRVVLKFLVESNGCVARPFVLEAHPEGVFEKSVLEAIGRWRFKPGSRSGNPVAAWVVLTFQFDRK